MIKNINVLMNLPASCYGAVVYIDGTETVAEDCQGAEISRSLDPATVISAALAAKQSVALQPNATFAVSTPVDIIVNDGNEIIGNNAVLDGINLIMVGKSDIYLHDFKITGGVLEDHRCKILMENSNNIKLNRITSFSVPAQIPGQRIFLIRPHYGTCHSIDIDHCASVNDGCHGITIAGEPGYAGSLAHDINIRNCRCINNGRATQSDPYVCGINVTDGVEEVYNIFVDGCYVEGSYLNGYHAEDAGIKNNVVIRNCVAKDCGQNGSNYGFTVHPGMTLQNCQASGNFINLHIRKFTTDTTVPMVIDNYVGLDSIQDDIVINDAGGSSAKTFISNAYSYNAGRCGIYACSVGNIVSNIFIKNMNIHHPAGFEAAGISNFFSTPISDSELEINCYGGGKATLLHVSSADGVILKGNFLMDASGGTTGVVIQDPIDLTFRDSNIRSAKVGSVALLQVQGTIHSLRLANLDLSLIRSGTATYGIRNVATGGLTYFPCLVRLHNGLT